MQVVALTSLLVGCSDAVTAPSIERSKINAHRPQIRARPGSLQLRRTVVPSGGDMIAYDQYGESYTLDVINRSYTRNIDGTKVTNLPTHVLKLMADNLAQIATTEHIIQSLEASPPDDPNPPTECELQGLPPDCGLAWQSVPGGVGEEPEVVTHAGRAGKATELMISPVTSSVIVRTKDGAVTVGASQALSMLASSIAAGRGGRGGNLAQTNSLYINAPGGSCFDLSLAIQRAHVEWNDSKNIVLNAAGEIINNAVEIGGAGAVIDWSAIPYALGAELEQQIAVHKINTRQLEVLASFYSIWNCWDWSTWQGAPEPYFKWAPAAFNGMGEVTQPPGEEPVINWTAAGGMPITCHVEQWEISYDSGKTWEPIWVRMCGHSMA